MEMMRTTPEPIFDIAKVIPELAGRGRKTIRLHPRRGTSAADVSKMDLS